MESSVKQLT
ncbi:Protein of unknown function [Bacillus mycoides]|nr:Protein of unknown function [Bacillus mycoides]